mgnify:FL=1
MIAMATTLENIRFTVEREIRATLENEQVIAWCNFANMDFGVGLNIPATATISLNETDLSYPEPTGLKEIVYMYLQSDFDNGINRPFKWPYRRFNGAIWFELPYREPDTLNIQYYKDLTHFTDITDTIDLEDRFSPIYTFYCLMKYYASPEAKERFGDAVARREQERAEASYYHMRDQVQSYYEFKNPQYVIEERW